MTPEQIAFEISQLAELEALEALITEMEAQIKSLRHGLGVVQHKLQDLAELPGQWRDDVKNDA